jgi:uncharacterized Ntn-hydrolase superfamily protein
MTYSICARDPETGDLGVAVQTCMFAVGAGVPWLRAGVGAVASQAFGEAAYGTRCLDALARGATAAEAIEEARALDPASAMRQLGVVSASGTAASFTGDLCVDACGDVQGDGYAIQANMMVSAEVWPAMAAAYESATGPFVDRLHASLVAGEAAGGDARGAMSAAIVIVSADPDELPGHDVRFDLRVDHSDTPLDELARLIRVRKAFAGFGRGTDALIAGDPEAALRELEAARAILPDDENIQFAYTGALMFNGRVDEARAQARALLERRPSWAVVVQGFVAKGLISLPDGVELDSFLTES